MSPTLHTYGGGNFFNIKTSVVLYNIKQNCGFIILQSVESLKFILQRIEEGRDGFMPWIVRRSPQVRTDENHIEVTKPQLTQQPTNSSAGAENETKVIRYSSTKKGCSFP